MFITIINQEDKEHALDCLPVRVSLYEPVVPTFWLKTGQKVLGIMARMKHSEPNLEMIILDTNSMSNMVLWKTLYDKKVWAIYRADGEDDLYSFLGKLTDQAIIGNIFERFNEYILPLLDKYRVS